MKPLISCLLFWAFTSLCPLSMAATEKDKDKSEPKKEDEAPVVDFEHEDVFVDVPDALRSKNYVHRAILSTIIRDTNQFRLGSFYVNHLMGFNAVYQPANQGGKSFAKYVAGALGLSVGYATQAGHSFEITGEVSAVSNLLIGYRYIFYSEKRTFWPYLGGGVGTEIALLRLSDLPVEALAYQGQTTLAYGAIGALIPIIDIGLRVEARFNFYGIDRLMLTTGIGVIFFI